MHEVRADDTDGEFPNSENGSLLALCLAGNQGLIGELVNLYRPYLTSLARGEWRGFLQPKAGISDVVQETIIKGIDAFAGFRGLTEAEFVAWLRQILVNEVQNTARRYQTAGRNADLEEPLYAVSLPIQTDSPSAVLVSAELRQRLHLALNQLPADYSHVVQLRQFEDLSWDEIAIRFNRSPEAVRKLWTRAIVELRKNLDLQAHVDSATIQAGRAGK